MEKLGYGTQLTVHATQAARDKLLDSDQMVGLLQKLADEVDRSPDRRTVVRVDADDGVSGVVLGSESQFYVHMFPESGTVLLRIFTRKDVSLSPLVTLFRQHFETGRFDGHISGVGKIAGTDEKELATVLAGDRTYVRARVEAMAGGS